MYIRTGTKQWLPKHDVILLTQKEKNQNCHQYVEVVAQLILDSLQKSWFEKLAPYLVGNEWYQKEEHDSNFHIEKASNQSPVKTHGYGFLCWIDVGSYVFLDIVPRQVAKLAFDGLMARNEVV